MKNLGPLFTEDLRRLGEAVENFPERMTPIQQDFF